MKREREWEKREMIKIPQGNTGEKKIRTQETPGIRKIRREEKKWEQARHKKRSGPDSRVRLY